MNDAAQFLARKLLLGHLDPTQRDEYKRTGLFSVLGASGRTYVIGPAMVTSHDTVGGNILTHCLVLRRAVPYEDAMLAKKLLIEGNERRFLRVARPSIRLP